VRFREDRSYLIVGGLRGLCGSLAVYMAMSGAKHLAVMSRSGYADDRSRGVIKQINALGAHIDLLTADVTVASDVERAFRQTIVPIGGIIQGAMVLRVSGHPCACCNLFDRDLTPAFPRTVPSTP
jgi:NAD(P)-dependent dehydrogenase (short-subunit alcohol dehydrogenase family)